MTENYFEDTIAAISTPAGSGGIGIIRISGPEAFLVCKKLFRAYLSVQNKPNTPENSAEVFEKMPSHSLKHGYIVKYQTDEILDECLISKMQAPNTYTREDVAEINCHGGPAVMRAILQELYALGVRPAEPGEFTKRAFLNGRLDLSEAEAVMDLIRAQTDISRKAAISQLDGKLSEEVEKIQQQLTAAIGEIEVTLEYPEYDMEAEAAAHTEEVLCKIITRLKELAVSYGRGRLIREGLRVVIAGKPNAGKSSLLNYLSGHSRAIVTDIPGTTRDIIEEFTEIDGYPVLVTDTAGLRNSEDPVEQIGIEKAREEIQNADLVLYMADPRDDEPIDAETEGILPENTIVLINKKDIAEEEQIRKSREKFGKYQIKEISVLQKDGMEEIMELIKQRFDCYNGGNAILTNARHKQLIDESITALNRGLEQYQGGMPLDCVTYDIRQCAEKLGEITGTSVSDEVIDNIFKRFCLGK